MPSQRLFVALEFQEQLSSQFHDMYRKLKTTADKSEVEAKWSPLKNLHLTLKFLGETEAELLPPLTKELQAVSRAVAPFELKLRGVGCFPDELEARVIWVGVQNKVALGELWQQVETALTALGFTPADQEFIPHITLGRLRNKQSVRKLIAPFLRKDYGSVVVKKLVLYESHMQGHYPVYLPLQEFEFTAGLRDAELKP